MQNKVIKALIVDENFDEFVLTKSLLEESPANDYALTWAGGKEDSLRRMTEEQFDVFLIDYSPDKGTGLEIMQEAMTRGCNGPFIMLTGPEYGASDLLGMEQAVADYLQKDELSPRALERAIRYALNQAKIVNKLHDQAFYDRLTGLANRDLLTDRIDHAIQRYARADAGHFAVLFIDLDRFKLINDSLGHHIGDLLLQEVSTRLQTCVRPGDTVARLGGDEFTMLLENAISLRDVEGVAERIQSILQAPMQLEDQELFITASIGIVISTRDHKSARAVLRDADTAMYRAKDAGKARSAKFDPSMHIQVKRVLQIENDLRRAIDRDQLEVVYQPIINMNDGQMSGVEALLRWNHHEEGYISPISFIPLAEETGLILPIGEWVLARACEQLKLWQESMPDSANWNINVNVSNKQFSDTQFADRVSDILESTGLPGHHLQLEITESVLMDNVQAVSEIITDLKQMDVKLYMDDFGTGYSSLSHLHSFPIDTIKIDRSFIRNMHEDDKKIGIVKSIVGLAHMLGKQVVAEGVELLEHRDTLQLMGCDFAQGYYYSRPVKIIGPDLVSDVGAAIA